MSYEFTKKKYLPIWLFCNTCNSKALILHVVSLQKLKPCWFPCLLATSQNTVLSLLVVKPAVDNFLDCEPNPSQMGYQLVLLSQLLDAPWHYNSSLQNFATFSTAIWWINRKYFSHDGKRYWNSTWYLPVGFLTERGHARRLGWNTRQSWIPHLTWDYKTGKRTNHRMC